MHTLLDLRGNIPSFVDITDGKVHDVNVLDALIPEDKIGLRINPSNGVVKKKRIPI
jgi:hypothetical protein